MSASQTDEIMLVAPEGDVTYMTGSGKALGATSFTVNSTTGWPTTTGFIVAIRNVNSAGAYLNDGSYTEWAATITGTTVNLGAGPSPVIGSDQVYSAASTTQVYVPVSSVRDNRLVTALLNQHKQADGSHGAITTDSITNNGALTQTGAAAINGATTFGNKVALTPGTVVSGATITPSATANIYTVTALAVGATIAAPAGSPSDGQTLLLRIKDNGSSQTLSWNAIYRTIGTTLPTSTPAGKVSYFGMKYNTADTVWDVLSTGHN